MRSCAKFGSGYPKLAEVANEMTSADAAVDQQLKQLKQRYRNDYEAAQHSEQMLRASFEAQKQKAYRLNEDAAQHAILKREVESTQQAYETLQLKLKQAGIAAGLASENVEVIDPAQVPSEPSDPKPLSSTLIGLGAGLLCGAAVALGIESVDDSVRTPEEAEQAAGSPVLGAIRTCIAARAACRHCFLGRRIGCPRSGTARSCCANPLRWRLNRIASCHSLLLASRPFSPQVVAVVSAMPLEGKTTTAANSAIALAQRGAKVLLVDADLRQPALHEFFEMPIQPGLRNLLATDANPYPACEIEQQPGLWVLPAGDSDTGSSRVLDVRSITPIIQRWREAYDYVLIDTPPIALVSDALVLSACADSVMLVVRCGLTSRRIIRRVCEALRRSQAKQSGVLMNAVDLAQHYGYPATGPGSAQAYYAKSHSL